MSLADYPLTIRANDSTDVLIQMFMGGVQRAIAAELDRREIRPGSIVALTVNTEAIAENPQRVLATFRIELRGPDDTEIAFLGVK